MVIGRLSCGRFAPGAGRVVVVRSLRSWLPTREGPLEPLSWHRRLLARPPAESSLLSVQGPRGGPASKRLRRSTSGKPPRPLSVPPGAAEPNDSPRQSLLHARGPKPPRRARPARGCKRPLGKTVLSKALLQPPQARPGQISTMGSAINRSTLSWFPSWFQHSGCAMFT
jgi:hypothetical protein